MKMNIIPFERVGNLIFGMKRTEVRKLFDSNFKEFMKWSWPNENTTDAYDNLDVHVYYDKNDKLEYVEIGPEYIKLMLNKISFFDYKFKDLIRVLQQWDENPTADELGCGFYDLGIYIHCDNDEGEIDLVSIYSKKYIDFIKNFNICT